MVETALANLYRAYIDCLNRQDWPNLHLFVAEDTRHNGRPFGLAGYCAMLERDFEAIPDHRFNIELMVCEPPYVASRLRFDCRPKGLFLDLPVNGRRVNFAENVFYRFRDERIAEVWSVIDKGAIEAQLGQSLA
jgi:predicted ester cyclase